VIDPELLALLAEYRYRKIFQISHEEYLNEPRGHIDWMLAIHYAEENNG